MVNFFAIYQFSRQILEAMIWWTRNLSHVYKNKWTWLKEKMTRLKFKSQHGGLSEKYLKHYHSFALLCATYPRLRLAVGVTFAEIYTNFKRLEDLMLHDQEFWKKSFTNGFQLNVVLRDAEGNVTEGKVFPVVQLHAHLQDYSKFKALYEEFKRKENKDETEEMAFKQQRVEYEQLFRLLHANEVIKIRTKLFDMHCIFQVYCRG